MSKTLNVPVQFGGVSIGETTGRIGVTVDREHLGLDDADNAFSNRRLMGRLLLGHVDDDPKQLKLIDSDHVIQTAFDVKGFRVGAASFSTGLTFAKQEVDISEAARFSKGSGRLIVDEIGEIPQPEKDRDDHETEESEPGTYAVDGPWREGLLSDLFEGQKTILKAFEKEKLRTVGDLSKWQEKDYNWLSNLEGVGPAKVKLIEDRLIEYFRDNMNDGGDS